MKKRIGRFVLNVAAETFTVTLDVFMMIIPLLYLVVKLGDSPNMFTEALATLMAYSLREQPAEVLSDVEIRAVYLGMIMAIVFLACLVRMIHYAINSRSLTPNEEQLYDYIERFRHKQRDAICSTLLHEIDQAPEKYQQDVRVSVK